MRPFTKLLRPRQWIKNSFVFAPLFFAHEVLNPSAWYYTLLAAFCFLSLSCAVYICNDLHDIPEDKRHPSKSKRPLASGEISVIQATITACSFAAVALFYLTALPLACAVIAVLYVVLNLLYTFYFKRIAILDIFLIASFYVLRVLMGCYAIQVTVSPWIILATFMLALFLGFGKRYHELGFEDYAKYKPNLQQYNRQLLDHLVTICASATFITYAIYTTEIAHQLGRVNIVYTVAFVAFGLFRYMQAIYVYNEGGEPENTFIKDKLQLVNAGLWLIVTLWLQS